MSMEDLVTRLRIEEDNRKNDKSSSGQSVEKANVDEVGKKRKFLPQGSNKKQPAAKKFSGTCHKCGKKNHKVAECRSSIDIREDKGKSKGKGKAEANLAEEGKLSHKLSEMDLCAVTSEVNLVGSNPREWWYDTGATKHICSDKGLFTSYTKSNSEESLFMGNSSTSQIEGHGKIVLKLTSEKELTLNNVLHVPDIRKNLISGSMLSKHGFEVKLASNNLVLTKHGVYLGKGHVKDGLFKMNVMTVLPKKNVSQVEINNKSSVAYIVESCSTWHERLGHVNYNSIRKLINLNLIPKCKIDNHDKYEVCVEAKLTKTPSPSVERSTEPLGLIHTDLCDLKYVQTRGGKKYFVTFIDDCTRYCYVYLLRSKDETLEKFKEYKLEVENQLSKTIKIVRSDRGGEYDEPFDKFCREHGIVHQTTAPYSPESNGIAERKNRTLKEMMNVLLLNSGLSQNMWGKRC
ncbi:hypothetical protein ACHQM5_019321 [Ranunculus cassubicifolius]